MCHWEQPSLGFEEFEQGTRVKIKSTGEEGEIWEALTQANICSVFVDGERKCRYFKLSDINFIES